MKTLKVYLYITLICASCTISPMKIESFEVADKDIFLRDQNDESRYVSQNYLVHNWKNNRSNEERIDSFVCSVLRFDFDSIYIYEIAFYEYSSTVNSQYYKHSKKFCELDMAYAVILTYEYRAGQFYKSKGNTNNRTKPLTKYKCDK